MEFPILPRLPGGLKDIIFGAMSVVHHSKLTADWRFRVRARNLVERFFNKIKHCRRVATRYDKLVVNGSLELFIETAC